MRAQQQIDLLAVVRPVSGRALRQAGCIKQRVGVGRRCSVGQVTSAAYQRLGGTFEQAGVRFVPGKTALMMDCLSTDS